MGFDLIERHRNAVVKHYALESGVCVITKPTSSSSPTTLAETCLETAEMHGQVAKSSSQIGNGHHCRTTSGVVMIKRLASKRNLFDKPGW